MGTLSGLQLQDSLCCPCVSNSLRCPSLSQIWGLSLHGRLSDGPSHCWATNKDCPFRDAITIWPLPNWLL